MPLRLRDGEAGDRSQSLHRQDAVLRLSGLSGCAVMRRLLQAFWTLAREWRIVRRNERRRLRRDRGYD